ncbi:MAG TPA: 5-formyltetrahydrofolate cyclo-ligase [Steroidobacteraceae bacterium]|nr:5-formyltetrahydrofolate cyclo-ligase [Steroidobacteraceae bacterium]
MSDEQEILSHHPSPITHRSSDRAQLRRTMRAQRNAVAAPARRIVARAVARHISHAQLLHKGQRIAVYAAFDGEIDLTPLVRIAKRAQCVLYAPRIVNMRARKMEFVELSSQIRASGVHSHQKSIREPRTHLQRRINPRLLDVVFVPVVAFDMHGWRLGFGAGFYDRKFQFLRRSFKKKPLLIGVAYEFQCVQQQKSQPWDIFLDAVVTENGLHRCYTR